MGMSEAPFLRSKGIMLPRMFGVLVGKSQQKESNSSIVLEWDELLYLQVKKT